MRNSRCSVQATCGCLQGPSQQKIARISSFIKPAIAAEVACKKESQKMISYVVSIKVIFLYYCDYRVRASLKFKRRGFVSYIRTLHSFEQFWKSDVKIVIRNDQTYIIIKSTSQLLDLVGSQIIAFLCGFD